MIVDKLIKKILQEATTDSTGARGSYAPPLQPGLRPFEKNILDPFSVPISNYDSPLVQYDSYDGNLDLSKKTVKKLEKKAEKASNFIKNHPYSTFSDEDGNNINPTPSGKSKTKKLEYVPINDRNVKLNEDLAVWFGKKKKPKGSSQPKGPWVDICRKLDGKHPPCGRSDASTGSYPKCRAAGVAGKMSDSEKRNACQQKRKAEKNDPQSGKGQKPVMVSHKKKTNENMKTKIITLTENDLTRIVRRVLNEQTKPNPGAKLNLFCQNDIVGGNFNEYNLTFDSDSDWAGGINGGGVKRVHLKYAPNPTRQSYEAEGETFTLDVAPETSLSPDFLQDTELDDSKSIGQGKTGEKMFLMGHRQNHLYFCSIDYGSDPSWLTYFNSL